MPWRSYIRSKRPFFETIPKLNLKFESFRVFRCIWNLFAGILLVRFPKIQLFSSQIPATSESSKFLDWVSSLVNCILFIYCILVNKKALFTLKYLENNRFFKFFYFAISINFRSYFKFIFYFQILIILFSRCRYLAAKQSRFRSITSRDQWIKMNFSLHDKVSRFCKLIVLSLNPLFSQAVLWNGQFLAFYIDEYLKLKC